LITIDPVSHPCEERCPAVEQHPANTPKTGCIHVTEFELVSDFEPRGGQPRAIEDLVNGLSRGYRHQTLLGVTGSGKTFMAANVIARARRPTLVISHNKTLAAQLCAEYKRFFPYNAVEYFVSYYDYYQPEAYLPNRDLYIEKEADINQEIDRLRHSATRSLMDRRDVIVVASVSCIFGLGSPEEYSSMGLLAEVGKEVDRESILVRLVEIQYERNDYEFSPGKFRVRGNSIDICPAYGGLAFRIELSGDTVSHLFEMDALTGRKLRERTRMMIYPAKHFVMPADKIGKAIRTIGKELEERLVELRADGKEFEAIRLKQRTLYDLELLREVGYCPGIENYSRHFDGRSPGQRPFTLMDYFPDDFLLVIDESHVTIPQVRAMYGGDLSRKRNLVDFGFRLPSAFDNRPLVFEEFEGYMRNVIYTSATPRPYECERSSQVVELVIRPTGLVDPEIVLRSTETQVDDVIHEIRTRAENGERVLVTTLTKRMAEDLSDYLVENGIRASYMHSGTGTMERVEILRKLRLGEIDVLVGINLLREGLDLPEVSLVAIMDADKEGFLRNETSLIQTMGRAARHVSGQVVLYADKLTGSIERAVDITNRRREIQLAYNRAHGIRPKGISKEVSDIAESLGVEGTEGAGIADGAKGVEGGKASAGMDVAPGELHLLLVELEEEMKRAAANLEFERAAVLRDRLFELRGSTG